MGRTPSAPFEPLHIRGESITIETSGKVLVLPTENADVLPLFNEWTEKPTVLRDNFGGLTGAGSPDYSVGTVYTPTDGVYLTDVSGTNSTKTLTGGKLKELGLLTVDPVGHTVTQDFEIVNTGESNNSTVVDNCDSVIGWSIDNGVGALDILGGVRFVGTGGAGSIVLKKSFGSAFTDKNFIVFSIFSSITTTLKLALSSTGILIWSSRIFPVIADTPTTFVLPITTTIGSVGTLPSTNSGYTIGGSTILYVGIATPNNTNTYTCILSSLSADTAKPAYLEIATPDNIQNTTLQCWTGSAYETVRIDSLNGAYSNISGDTTKLKMLDGTSFDDVYTAGLGRAVFPKGAAEETKNGSTGSITYSANQGTKNRIGYMFSLPPSDGGRTNFNKLRLRVITAYQDTNGSTVADLSGNGNNGTIYGGVVKLNGGGLKFDGSTGYVKIPSATSINDLTSFTICGIINKTASGDTHLYNKYPKDLYVHTGRLRFDVLCSTGVGIARCSNTFTLNVDTFITITYDNTGTRIPEIYINGTKQSLGVATAATGDLIPDSIYTAMLGAKSSYGTLFNGIFKTFSIYDSVLSQDDITALYNQSNISSTAVASYKPTINHMGSTSHIFADSTNASYGLQNVTKPWIALYDPASSEVDFYLFTHRPKNLTYKRDETGEIYEVTLYPGNGSIYWGRVHYSDLTVDSDSNTIPDCLEASIAGSVTKFLENYSMVIP